MTIANAKLFSRKQKKPAEAGRGEPRHLHGQLLRLVGLLANGQRMDLNEHHKD
jgi:hypothetical protein